MDYSTNTRQSRKSRIRAGNALKREFRLPAHAFPRVSYAINNKSRAGSAATSTGRAGHGGPKLICSPATKPLTPCQQLIRYRPRTVWSIRHAWREFREEQAKAKMSLDRHVQYSSMIAASIAKLHRLLNLALQIGCLNTSVRGRSTRQVLGRPIEVGEGIGCRRGLNRRTSFRQKSHRSCHRWSIEQQRNHVGAEPRRRHGNRLDLRTTPHIVHNSVVWLSEFPSIGELLAYLWHSTKREKNRRGRGALRGTQQYPNQFRYGKVIMRATDNIEIAASPRVL